MHCIDTRVLDSADLKRSIAHFSLHLSHKIEGHVCARYIVETITDMLSRVCG